MTKRGTQQELDLRTWGGKRKNSGRPPTGARAGVSHQPRPRLSGREPVHVTIKVAADVWNLRSRRCAAVVRASLAAHRPEMRITHYSIQGNHIHLIVEPSNRDALARGMKGLQVRMARSLNRLMLRTGPVFVDRYHAHVLRTPTETRNAVRYVLTNERIHARRRGDERSDSADPFAEGPSPLRGLVAVSFTGITGSGSEDFVRRGEQIPLIRSKTVVPPETWLLRTAVGNQYLPLPQQRHAQ